MYENISIFIIASIASFASMILVAIFSNFVPVRFATPIMIVLFLLFLILGFSMVPIMIRGVLKGNIGMWQKFPLTGTGFIQNLRSFIIQNQEKIFYRLLFTFWGMYVIGLLIALPFMIKDGFFKPL